MEGGDQSQDTNAVLSSMQGLQFNSESSGADNQDVLEEVTLIKEPIIVDFQHLIKLANQSDQGNRQLEELIKNWENDIRLLRQELHNLSKQQVDQIIDLNKVDTTASHLEKLQGSIHNLERQSSPVEELSQLLTRADNFLHFVLQNAPIVMGHQDKDMRYRFIFNYFPSLGEQDIIGKTDVEIFSGATVKEFQDFKQEVLERGLPAKREITFETDLFGSKIFLIYVEPVFSKTGESMGVNYIGMEVTDQVRKREKMAKLREEKAVQKAKKTQLHNTIHITEESRRAKQMLATIRSPLSGLVSMAKILSTTRLDQEQRQLLDVMLSSAESVLQLTNDLPDLSKVESGVKKTEAAKLRPREVVKHVLRTAAASLQKLLVLEGHVADDVPVEVMRDVFRIREKLTSLIRYFVEEIIINSYV